MVNLEAKLRRLVYALFEKKGYDYIKIKYKLLKRKFKKSDHSLSYYVNNLDSMEIDNNTVLIECMLGNEFSGNGFYIANEIVNMYPKLNIKVAVKNKKHIQKVLDFYNMELDLVTIYSKEYNKCLLEAKYLFNDVMFPDYFIKRTGQVYINTWSGIPLASIVRDMENMPLSLSSIQRNFFHVDILSLNNEHTIHMVNNDYMLEHLELDNIQKNPTPRNSIFFDEEHREGLKRKLGISNTKKIVLWIPKLRDISSDLNNIEENVDIIKRMAPIVSKLNIPIEFYVYLDPLLTGKVSVNKFGLKAVPNEVEIYDFANITDVLVTDYSSMLFDYANLNKPIILVHFDRTQYREEKGLCFEIEDLPFMKVKNENEFIHALEGIESQQVNYLTFNNIYNPLENKNAASQLLDKVFSFSPKSQVPSKKEKVLIYPGGLSTNGITTAFINLISNIDTSKRDYYIWLPNFLTLKKAQDNFMKVLGKKMGYIVSPTGLVMKKDEEIAYIKLMNYVDIDDDEHQVFKNMIQREIQRTFGKLTFDHLIHFSGYDTMVSEMFQGMSGKLHMWVHNNMKAEYESRKNFNLQSINLAYDAAYNIAVVNDTVKEVLLKDFFSEQNKSKIYSVHNTVNMEEVILKSLANEKYMNKELTEILHNENIIKFINIGRFSSEKGHLRLIEAFTIFRTRNPSKKVKLILIGGHGAEYNKTKTIQKNSEYQKDILLYQDINPLPILKYSDLMVLSSFYEGLPMVFFEALILGIPILSTAIPGPKEFLESGYGYTCKNTTEGIVDGMQNFVDGKFTQTTKDLKVFNQQSVSEFEKLLEL